ncbi:septal ring lytic transglycosylase RlpA family protein [Bartonella alsatica]|uniref:Endolytic peptidoglycan transglycosylase RlpA n=2 Tax=Bartonella alsatica TaxID=52764 RepID=J0PTK4_9HYPH|nr:septal ring lytic transglycosylase RlpA family protein [Bartonella alsatica]EJF75871.1 rare lipoprotein A [Bartonella alsatica IBS 382]QLC51485.1 septal ring lytic transglycosylase RlpA family protein [Bartonella alsatica]
MLLNSKEKFISILNSTFQFLSVVVMAQLLVSCCASQTAHFVIKSFHNNKADDVKTTVLSKKNSREQNQSKEKRKGRAIVGKPYKIKGKWYYPQNDPTYKRVGEASWYGSDFHGRLTANGEVYDMNLLTAAHPTMPLPSYARVTNLKNGSSIIVRVNDRGPFMKDRIIDLSKQAAQILGYANAGVTNVKVEYVSEAPVGYYDAAYLMASYISGNDASSSLAFTGIPKENITLERFSANSQKHSNKILSVKLPENGPILISKPVLFDQVAFVNKLSKK